MVIGADRRVAAIVPDNFPLTLMGTKLAPALTAGNTIVVKPAATTPLATLRIAELMLEAEFPPGVVNVITGRGKEVGDALATHATSAGSLSLAPRSRPPLMEMAAPRFKRITMELGGRTP